MVTEMLENIKICKKLIYKSTDLIIYLDFQLLKYV